MAGLISETRQFSQHRRKTMPSKFCLILSSTALRFIQYLCFVSSQHMEDVLRSQRSAAILLHNFFFSFFSFNPSTPRPPTAATSLRENKQLRLTKS